MLLTMTICLTAALFPTCAATLKKETRDQFARYVQLTDARNARELKSGPFLWIDSLPEADRESAYAQLKSGEIEIRERTTKEDGREIRCPAGMIHHWGATAFIPGAQVSDVLAILQNYDRHATYYQPEVEASRLESREGDHFVAFLRFRRSKMITVVLDTLHDIHYFQDSATRTHSRSSAVRIAEVENPGQQGEREKAPGDDGGYLWGMETWWRLEQKDGGVYVQNEVVSLTRDIPTGLGWAIGPFVTGIPKESLKFTMEATRRAVEQKLNRATLTR